MTWDGASDRATPVAAALCLPGPPLVRVLSPVLVIQAGRRPSRGGLEPQHGGARKGAGLQGWPVCAAGSQPVANDCCDEKLTAFYSYLVSISLINRDFTVFLFRIFFL